MIPKTVYSIKHTRSLRLYLQHESDGYVCWDSRLFLLSTNPMKRPKNSNKLIRLTSCWSCVCLCPNPDIFPSSPWTHTTVYQDSITHAAAVNTPSCVLRCMYRQIYLLLWPECRSWRWVGPVRDLCSLSSPPRRMSGWNRCLLSERGEWVM